MKACARAAGRLDGPPCRENGVRIGMELVGERERTRVLWHLAEGEFDGAWSGGRENTRDWDAAVECKVWLKGWGGEHWREEGESG